MGRLAFDARDGFAGVAMSLMFTMFGASGIVYGGGIWI